MNLHSIPLRITPLLAIAAGLLSANCAAMEAGAFTNPQPMNEDSAQVVAVAAPNSPSDIETRKSLLKNPSSMLLAPTVQFKNAAGTPGYYLEAFAHHCSAARSGDAHSQFALGWLYANGRGVAKNDEMAVWLYQKAAEQGHARAQEVLAGMAIDTPQPELPACMLPDPPAPVVAATTFDTLPDRPLETIPFYPKDGPIFNLVNKLSPRYEIDTELAMAFIAVESGFNVKATSPKNAQGLMQLIPETAKRFRVKNPYNAEDNIKGGLAYLQWLLAFFQGNVELVAAAYNAGERTVEKYKGVPPYPETRNYVQKIAALYRKTTHPFRADLVKASSFLP